MRSTTIALNAFVTSAAFRTSYSLALTPGEREIKSPRWRGDWQAWVGQYRKAHESRTDLAQKIQALEGKVD